MSTSHKTRMTGCRVSIPKRHSCVEKRMIQAIHTSHLSAYCVHN